MSCVLRPNVDAARVQAMEVGDTFIHNFANTNGSYTVTRRTNGYEYRQQGFRDVFMQVTVLAWIESPHVQEEIQWPSDAPETHEASI